MIIVHCLLKETWDSIKNERYYGSDLVEQDGFIHCSPINYFWRVVHLFESTLEERLILCIDTDLVENEVKWEDGDLNGRKYPHIYGELNTNAVTNVLPYLRDEHGKFILNDELKELVSKDQLQEFLF